MSYQPNRQDQMDENEVCAEIGNFVNDQITGAEPPVPEAPVPNFSIPDFSVPETPAEEIPVPISFTEDLPSLDELDEDFSLEDLDLSKDLDDPEEPTEDPIPNIFSTMKLPDFRNMRKARPKRKHSEILFGLPQLLAVVIWLGLVLIIGVTGGRVLWLCASDVLAFGRPDQEVSITVTAEDNLDSIITKLSDAGLIRYDWLFRLYAGLSGAEEDIVTGTFTLNTAYDYHALVNEMSSSASKREEVKVQIPEGYSCRQIFQLLEEKGVATVADLEEYAASGELDDYWFLENVERGDKYCLEGFLFPDTYNFYTGGGAAHALRKLLNGFEHQFNQDLQDQIITLNTLLAEKMRANGNDDAYVVANMFDVRDVVIVASLIEKEAANASESPNIASVIYNRLFSWGSNPRYLGIDAALVYALDGKTNLTSEDTKIDHPYNTYKNTGLTPGPISNPGMSSIKAALNPASTNYYYYVLNEATGEHVFTKTYDEHVAAGG